MSTPIKQTTISAIEDDAVNVTPLPSSENGASSHASLETSSSSEGDLLCEDTLFEKDIGFVGVMLSYGPLLRNAGLVLCKVLARWNEYWRPESWFARAETSFSMKLVCIMAMMLQVPGVNAMPLPDADGLLSTTPDVPNALWFACAGLEASGVIVFFWTLKHKFASLVWRDFLGVMSLMTSFVWTSLYSWDKAAIWRPLVLASCHGLVLNFTLQLCIGIDDKALFGALVLGFSVASALISSLFAALPSNPEPAAVDFSISNMVLNGLSQWATSPLYFTIWAILVKVAFFTCDAIQSRHACPLSTTRYGKSLMRIAPFIMGPISWLYLTIGRRQADDGRSGVDDTNMGPGDSNQELQTMPSSNVSGPEGQASGHDLVTSAAFSVVTDTV